MILLFTNSLSLPAGGGSFPTLLIAGLALSLALANKIWPQFATLCPPFQLEAAPVSLDYTEEHQEQRGADQGGRAPGIPRTLAPVSGRDVWGGVLS